MKIPAIVWICVALVLVSGHLQRPVSQSKGNATLEGTISDSVGGSPLVGAGVTVRTESDLVFVKSTLTEAPRGTYEINNLTAGKKYWVSFCKEGYVAQYASVTVPTKMDTKLTLRRADKVYWIGKTHDFIAVLNDTGQADQERFKKTWQEFQTSAVSAEGKAYVARDLKNQLRDKPGLWADVKPFTAYADADPGKLEQAERAIWLNNNDPIVFSVDPVILVDMRTGKEVVARIRGDKQPSPADPCSNPYQ